MTTNIYLVRHAASDYTPDELNRPLSQEGKMDAEKVTALMIKENITRVYSSPYKRAIQTVDGIAMHFALPMHIEEDFKERRLAEGPVENFHEAIFKCWQEFNYSLPGGECGCAAQERGVQALQTILRSCSGENIAIGTHGNIMVLIMNYFDKIYDYGFWKKLNMPDIYKLIFEEEELINVQHIWK